MRIENIILTNMILSDKDFFFNENSVLKGKVISSFGDSITIKFPELGIIEAEIDSNILLKDGDEIKFLVKSADDNGISLKPIFEEIPKQNISNLENKNSIVKLLNENNIEENDKTINLVENMMKQNLSINKENILMGLKVLEKFVELTKIDDNQKITLIDIPYLKENLDSEGNLRSEIKPEDMEIKYLIVEDNKNPDEVKLNKFLNNEDKLDNHQRMEETKLNREIPMDKDLSSNNKELKELVKEYLGSYSTEKEDDFIKTIGLFLKSNIKPSLSNIRNMRQLNQDPIEFVKELKDFIIKNDKEISELLMQKNQKPLNSKEIEVISTDKNKLGEISKTIEELLKTSDTKASKELDTVMNKLNFLKDLDRDWNFLFYPLNFGEKKELEGLLSFIKDKKNKSSKKKDLNVYISLNTHYLGNVKIFCTLSNDVLQVKIHIKEEDFEIFKNSEDKLIEKINSIGYSVNGIDFIINREFSMIDHMDVNPSSVYLLDLKA